MLQIYNSLTRQKERFEPIEPGKASLYVCGMTVYDYCHIGHARVMVVFDVVARYLRSRGYDVTYVRNITDIDDKIIKRAAEGGYKTIDELTEKFIRAMHEDAAVLGVLPPDREPRATTSINEIVAMIDVLMKKDYAYRSDNGDVYYRVNRFAGYGRLSGKRLEDLRAGERVEVNEAKEDPLDFVLWKAAKPGEPQWDSPWGPGRPGWHIECSAMATHCLGDHFDIHGGGMDLMFPHHENEIAQSEAATGHKFVNVWMHNGFVQIDEQKMSKSLGNFFTVREVLNHYAKKYNSKEVAGEIIRFFILNSHYRSPLNYSDENLDDVKVALDRFYTALRNVSEINMNVAVHDNEDAQRFHAAMDDDFNTSEAIAVLFDIARDLNRAKDEKKQDEASRIAGALKHLGGVLGLLQLNPNEYFQIHHISGLVEITVTASGTLSTYYTPKEIEDLIARRNEARRNKDWIESDRIRDELNKKGIVLEDGPQSRVTLRTKDEPESKA